MDQFQSTGNDYDGVSSQPYDYNKLEVVNINKCSTVVQLLDDSDSNLDIKVVMQFKEFKNNCAEIIGNALKKEKKKVSIEGPSLSIICNISGIKKTAYDREIGYIQSTKKFFEIQFEKAIFYSDFHSNLLHGQDEVLDCDGENIPFYSKDSSFTISAGKKYLRSETKIIKLNHFSICELRLYSDWGSPQKLEKYQKFFGYVVERSMIKNEWKYVVLHSFEWFIDLKWIEKNSFEWDWGSNKHKPGRHLPKFNENYTCNNDEFEYWIDTEKNPEEFHIYKYPISIYKKPLNKSEKIYENIRNQVSEQRIVLEIIKKIDLKVKKICDKTTKMISELNGNQNTNSEMLNCDCFDVKGITNSNGTNQLSLGENIFCEEIKRKLSELMKLFSQKVLSEEKFCKNIEEKDITKKQFSEEIQKAVLGNKISPANNLNN